MRIDQVEIFLTQDASRRVSEHAVGIHNHAHVLVDLSRPFCVRVIDDTTQLIDTHDLRATVEITVDGRLWHSTRKCILLSGVSDYEFVCKRPVLTSTDRVTNYKTSIVQVSYQRFHKAAGLAGHQRPSRVLQSPLVNDQPSAALSFGTTCAPSLDPVIANFHLQDARYIAYRYDLFTQERVTSISPPRDEVLRALSRTIGTQLRAAKL